MLELSKKQENLRKQELKEMDQQHDHQLHALDSESTVVNKRRKVTHKSVEILEDSGVLGIREKILNLDQLIANKSTQREKYIQQM